MTPNIKPLIAGNWKMHGTSASLSSLEAMATGFAEAASDADGVICVPATLLERAAGVVEGSSLQVGGQDCHPAEKGAHTGDISPEMLSDCGAIYVIVGHSERRADHGESDGVVADKAKAAWRAGLIAIICIGETEAQRKAGETFNVLEEQMAGSVPAGASATNTVIAYEPVWAIGTGLTPEIADIEAAHAHIRQHLRKQLGAETADSMRLLYGGSVKPGNAGDILSVENVDGALIGGASLKAEDYLGIVGSVG
ncbi:triose-phosphate isomerase [Nitratireductor basaltis]|uniref:Triosephosphate isomerase n=1 Tax=Nitratireductor basaltis TaxID=472175 RepID=A0A084UAI5_9HYPH|nr:triose-phosphate isomerase [Nitratireductor basaltis]KFB09971.1 Triosephosphate isomerase [Nitratireductor basaltis]